MVETWIKKFGLTFGCWLTTGLALLLALELWDPEFYFIIASVGFVFALEYSEPESDRPTWHRRAGWLLLLDLVVFGNIVITWAENVAGVSIM